MMMTGHWTLNDISWEKFDKTKVDPELAKIVRAAALVEFGGDTYADYLNNVFAGEPGFTALTRQWAREEVQHGEALAKWATLADPTYNLDEKYKAFRDIFQINVGVSSSIRGSKSGELIARCMVETGTSSYYAAMGEATDEPVLKEICAKIAADELRHYKLFYTQLKLYLEKEGLGRFQRVRIALARIGETEDDELAAAYYAANNNGEAYDRATWNRAYMKRAYGLYRPRHIERAVGMLFKACGLSPQSLLHKGAVKIAWWAFDRRAKQLEKLAA